MFMRHYIALGVSVMVTIMGSGAGDTSKDRDREECTDQLVGLATCLPYVGGEAKAPTPDCCNGLKQVLKNDKKCLCVIVRDRNDPQLGLKINVTLALGLPSVCHAPADVSKCPALLHLDPNSPEAQVFYQFAGKGRSASSPASSPRSSPTPSSSVGAGGRSISTAGTRTSKSGSCCRWFSLEAASMSFSLLFYVLFHEFIFDCVVCPCL